MFDVVDLLNVNSSCIDYDGCIYQVRLSAQPVCVCVCVGHLPMPPSLQVLRVLCVLARTSSILMTSRFNYIGCTPQLRRVTRWVTANQTRRNRSELSEVYTICWTNYITWHGMLCCTLAYSKNNYKHSPSPKFKYGQGHISSVSRIRKR